MCPASQSRTPAGLGPHVGESSAASSRPPSKAAGRTNACSTAAVRPGSATQPHPGVVLHVVETREGLAFFGSVRKRGSVVTDDPDAGLSPLTGSVLMSMGIGLIWGRDLGPSNLVQQRSWSSPRRGGHPRSRGERGQVGAQQRIYQSPTSRGVRAHAGNLLHHASPDQHLNRPLGAAWGRAGVRGVAAG